MNDSCHYENLQVLKLSFPCPCATVRVSPNELSYRKSAEKGEMQIWLSKIQRTKGEKNNAKKCLALGDQPVGTGT